MKYCSKCGAELNDNDVFCNKCGQKVGEEVTVNKAYEEARVNYEEKGLAKDVKNVKAIVGFIFSLVALFYEFGFYAIKKEAARPGSGIEGNMEGAALIVAFIFTAIAFIISAGGFGTALKYKKGKVLATIGFVISIICLILTFVIMIAQF